MATFRFRCVYRKVDLKCKIIKRRQKNFTKKNVSKSFTHNTRMLYHWKLISSLRRADENFLIWESSELSLYSWKPQATSITYMEFTIWKKKCHYRRLQCNLSHFSWKKERNKRRALHSNAVQTTQPSGKLLIKSRINRANKYSYNTTSCQSVNNFL